MAAPMAMRGAAVSFAAGGGGLWLGGGVCGGVGWLCLRGGCDGVGVDGCDGVGEGADGALVVVDEGLFEGSFDEGGIGGRDGACQFFCVWGLEVGGDSVGVGGGELGEGLFPVGGGVSLDEACGGCSFVGGFACVCEALGSSFVFDVANSQP